MTFHSSCWFSPERYIFPFTLHGERSCIDVQLLNLLSYEVGLSCHFILSTNRARDVVEVLSTTDSRTDQILYSSFSVRVCIV